MQTDNVMPDGKWSFDAEVTSVFEDMLKRSIPQYDVMRQSVFDIGSAFVQAKTDIIDLGCSRGDSLAPFIEKFGAFNRYIGIDVSEPMLSAAKDRFKSWINTGLVEIRSCDLRERFPPCRSSLTLSVLTLQFTPIEYRQRILSNAFKHLEKQGAFILIEKVLGADADIDKIMTERYLSMKADNGYSTDQIDRKRSSLEGVLVPVTARWNEDLLRQAGFKHVDCFWRWMNFAGWVAIKD